MWQYFCTNSNFISNSIKYEKVAIDMKFKHETGKYTPRNVT